jgi:uncharacterized protein YdeI (YjbR/CyaY-like superfamily)
MPGDSLPPHAVEAHDRAAWRRWLSRHHTQANGVWLVMARKGGDYESPTYDEAVEEALCFGWIDSKPGRLDERRSLLWFAPRKPKSAWSGPNKRRVEALEAAGLMHGSGQAKVDEARRNGLWTKLDAVESLDLPADLAVALAARPPAATVWDAFPRSVKRGILEWIVQARKPQTRTERVLQTAELAQRGERAHQWSATRSADEEA